MRSNCEVFFIKGGKRLTFNVLIYMIAVKVVATSNMMYKLRNNWTKIQ